MKDRAFSLIELMVAVSVLAIGIVMVARSFLSASNALTSASARITALNFLEGKMEEIEEMVLKDSDKILSVQEDKIINSKTFRYKVDLDKIKIGTEEKFINKITLSAEWKEGTRSYDEILATYTKTQKKELPE